MKRMVVFLFALFVIFAVVQAEAHRDLASSTVRAHDYTIQLVAMNDLNQANSYIRAHKLQTKAIVLKVHENGCALYKVVYGDYANRFQAVKALNQLPPELKCHEPWVRQFADFLDK